MKSVLFRSLANSMKRFFLFSRHQIEQTVEEVVFSKGLLAVSAEVSMLLGMVIVIDHSWEPISPNCEFFYKL